MYSNFMFLDQFLFESSCKDPPKTHTHSNTRTRRDSDEYSIAVFSKDATIINTKTNSKESLKRILDRCIKIRKQDLTVSP